MKYHKVQNKAEMDAAAKGTFKQWDVIVIDDTRDVYHIAEANGAPVFAFNVKPRAIACPRAEHSLAETLTVPAVGDKPLMRVRFYLEAEDPRPMTWPLKHPWWTTGGYTYFDKNNDAKDGHAIVAYVESLNDIATAWPESRDIDVMEVKHDFYVFTTRFGVSAATMAYYGYPDYSQGDSKLVFAEAVEHFKKDFENCYAAAIEHIPAIKN